MTPAQLNVYATARQQQAEERIEMLNRSVYNLSALIRPMIWSDHPPAYEQAFGLPKKEMTDEQMYANVRALNRMLGGEEVD